MSGTGSDNGWLEAAVAWEVCASLHRQYCKGKDALFTTRQSDFVKHAENARGRASHGQAPAQPEVPPDQMIAECGIKASRMMARDLTRFDAADMATAAAQGFRDGVAKEQQAGWEAIETAPKDGLRVILTEGGRVFRGVFVTVEFMERRDGDGNYIDQTDPDAYWMDLASGDVCYPTHWQPEAPLPPPPSSAQKDTP